jgi:hypothetical protein
VPDGAWRIVLSSDDPAYGGRGVQPPAELVGPTELTLSPELFVCYLEEDSDA